MSRITKAMPKLFELRVRRIKLEEELNRVDEEIFMIEDSISDGLKNTLLTKHAGLVMEAHPGSIVNLYTEDEWEKLNGDQ